MIIGICGNSGSGKTTMAKIIEQEIANGIHCDIDKIGHDVLKLPAVKEKLLIAFGQEVIIDDIIDRKRLGMLVFNSDNAMKILTDITWPYMEEMINQFIIKNKNNNIILDWILLPKTKYFNMCDIKILVDVPYEIRKERAIKRDNITEEKFNIRDKASIEYDNSKFDLIVNDDVDKIRKLVKRYDKSFISGEF